TISFNDRTQLSQEALGLVDRVGERFVHAAYEDALELIAKNVESLRRLAELLVSQKDLERVDILSAISNTSPPVKLQSGFGTRVAGPLQSAEPAVRPLRSSGGIRLRDPLRGGAVAAAIRR